MPNELDDLWKIDVKKASASPPLVVRQRLRSVIDKIAGASNRVYTERGRRITGANATPFWARRVDKNQISYELNRQNPTIAGFFESLEEKQAKDFESLLRLVERSFPTDALFSDLASKPENLDVPQIDTELLKEMLALTIGYLKESGLSNKQIATQIRRSDPYRLHWSEAQPIVEKTLGGTADVG
jgi:hypothetical protein